MMQLITNEVQMENYQSGLKQVDNTKENSNKANIHQTEQQTNIIEPDEVTSATSICTSLKMPQHRRYQHILDIGTGSFGKAILVKDLTVSGSNKKNLYVMKVIDIVWLGSKERQDAVNEVKLLSSLKHPYIISYKESFVENGRICIVMEYADCGDLFETVLRHKKKKQYFSEKQIVRWITQAALALKYIHERLILHRDLKTQNLFLTSTGRLCIGDFGIAKLLCNSSDFAKTQVGTPYYLSPEICQNRPYTWASDIWALGCIIYELASLSVPFHASNIGALLQKIIKNDPPPFPSRYSNDLQKLYEDCLSGDWKCRPTAAQILRRDFIQDEIRCMLKDQQGCVPNKKADSFTKVLTKSPYIGQNYIRIKSSPFKPLSLIKSKVAAIIDKKHPSLSQIEPTKKNSGRTRFPSYSQPTATEYDKSNEDRSSRLKTKSTFIPLSVNRNRIYPLKSQSKLTVMKDMSDLKVSTAASLF